MGVLTSSAEYTAFVTEMNTAIKNFVILHPNAVKYSKTDNGKSLITLFYGQERDVNLKKIADTIDTTLNDASFVINGLPVTPIKANNNIIVFEGNSAAVEAAIARSNNYPVLKVLSEQEITVDVNRVVSTIVEMVNKLVRNRSSIPESYLRKGGITIDENSKSYGRLKINASILKSYTDELSKNINRSNEDTNPSLEAPDEVTDTDNIPFNPYPDPAYTEEMNDVFDKLLDVLNTTNYIIGIKNKKKSLFTGKLETTLEEQNLKFERVTNESITIAYLLDAYSEYYDNKMDKIFVKVDNTGEVDPKKTYYLRFEDKTGDVTYRPTTDADFDVEYNEGTFEEINRQTEVYDSTKTYYVLIPGVDVLGPDTPSAYEIATIEKNNFDVDPETNEVSFKDGETYYTMISAPFVVKSFKESETYYVKG